MLLAYYEGCVGGNSAVAIVNTIITDCGIPGANPCLTPSNFVQNCINSLEDERLDQLALQIFTPEKNILQAQDHSGHRRFAWPFRIVKNNVIRVKFQSSKFQSVFLYSPFGIACTCIIIQ